MFGRTGENHPRPMLGKTHSDETKALMSKVHKGKTLSEETKALIRKALSGDNHPKGMLGKSHSVETLAKIHEGSSNELFSNKYPAGSWSQNWL